MGRRIKEKEREGWKAREGEEGNRGGGRGRAGRGPRREWRGQDTHGGGGEEDGRRAGEGPALERQRPEGTPPLPQDACKEAVNEGQGPWAPSRNRH